jgi:hypothetical protein
VKIPFMDEDESCVCKGTGFIDHDFGTKEVPQIVRSICLKCVEFKEATVETLVGRDGEFYHLKDGRVVPEE